MSEQRQENKIHASVSRHRIIASRNYRMSYQYRNNLRVTSILIQVSMIPSSLRHPAFLTPVDPYCIKVVSLSPFSLEIHINLSYAVIGISGAEC